MAKVSFLPLSQKDSLTTALNIRPEAEVWSPYNQLETPGVDTLLQLMRTQDPKHTTDKAWAFFEQIGRE